MHVALPEIGTARAWRDHARSLLADLVPPEEVSWSLGDGCPGLFGDIARTTPKSGKLMIAKRFVTLADTVAWHSDPETFARLYAFLWRLNAKPSLITDRGDAALARLHAMEKAVRRDIHKMRAFLRFREVGDPSAPRRRFAAWFEPAHRIVEPNTDFFARRFGDMDWMIVTPTLTATFENGEVRLSPGQAKPPLPEDGAEELWTTYFRNIFNPARLKVKAMTAEMPKKYWKNMPEAAAIPELISSADRRVAEMRERMPTLPPIRAERIAERLPEREEPKEIAEPKNLETLEQSLEACRRCPLHGPATQAVPGKGPPVADLMIVGEQPGDREDLEGRPFVGPAGQLFDRIAREAGLDREQAYVTNAVKHFKYQPRGKRRIHQRPNAGEVQACRWWLDLERRLVSPRLIVAMGATAIGAITGNARNVTARRGCIETAQDGTPVLITVHPSYLLRLPDAELRRAEEDKFRADLRSAVSFLGNAA